MAIKLIADSGSTKTEWCLMNGKANKAFYTQGLSPYFLSAEQIEYIINEELKHKFKNVELYITPNIDNNYTNPNRIVFSVI